LNVIDPSGGKAALLKKSSEATRMAEKSSASSQKRKGSDIPSTQAVLLEDPSEGNGESETPFKKDRKESDLTGGKAALLKWLGELDPDLPSKFQPLSWEVIVSISPIYDVLAPGKGGMILEKIMALSSLQPTNQPQEDRDNTTKLCQ
jgi:hypothetical protein